MATIVVFQHHDAFGPSRLGRTLRDHGFRLDIRRLDLGDEPPVDLDNVHGVVVLGGPVWGNEPWAMAQASFLERCHGGEIAVIAVGAGMNLLTRAIGGTTMQLSEPETGFIDIDVLVPGQIEPILAGFAWNSRHLTYRDHAPQDLPKDAVLLATSTGGAPMIFRAGIRTFAFGFELAADRDDLPSMLSTEPSMLERADLTADAVHSQAEERFDRAGIQADRLCVNLVTYAFPFDRFMAV